MTGKCVVCGTRIRWTRSKSYCVRHYWRLRLLSKKPRFELDELAAEADNTKKLIAIVLDAEPTDDDVADLQR
jgi:hypothetical protein